MNFKDLVYDNTCYLRDKGFIIKASEICILICKDTYSLVYFKLEDVYDDLEPLLHSKGLLNKINAYNGYIKYEFHISNGLDNIFKKIFNIGNISNICIYNGK